jgi:hypothetical protein
MMWPPGYRYPALDEMDFLERAAGHAYWNFWPDEIVEGFCERWMRAGYR